MYEKWNEGQYRSAEIDALEAQRDAISEELVNPESEIDLAELRSQSDACIAEFARRNAAAELRNASIEALKCGEASLIERSRIGETQEAVENEVTSSVEYRTAFMRYMMSGERSDILMRGNENTKTTDVGTVIPHPIINEIIEHIEHKGMVISRINRTSYPTGQEIPTSAMKPVASWVAEGAGSDRQKKTTSHITFTHHKLRCEISVTMEVHVMSLSAFERKFIENVVEAMLIAQETAIVKGDGTGKPKGILAETPETGQAIEIAKTANLTYDLLCDSEAAIPAQYESNVVWTMTKKTFFEFMNVKDADGNNVATVHYTMAQRPEYRLMGREVVIVPSTYLGSYAKNPTENTIFAYLFNYKDYTLNTNYDMGVSMKQDWDTEDWLRKAVLACDGKVVDKNSLVTLTIKNA